MSERRLYLDVGPGETRGVVTLDGRPERLLIARDDDAAAEACGARLVARVRKVERASNIAFLDLGEARAAVLNLGADTGGLAEGAAIEVEIRAEARRGKSAVARFVGPEAGEPRLIAAASPPEARLAAFAPGAPIQRGAVARSVADGAQEEALRTVFDLPGGGTVAIETTRALTAVDVDLGDRPGAEAKRAARSANFAAIGAAARLLRLKGLGGLVVIDLVGRGHDAPALLAAARSAFGPDNPGVALATISRFGALELTVPRKARGAVDILTDDQGRASALTLALSLLRALERQATADGGGRFEALAAPEVTREAAPGLRQLIARLGARVAVRGEPGRPRDSIEILRL